MHVNGFDSGSAKALKRNNLKISTNQPHTPGEQSFLFQVYNELSEGEMCCSGTNENGMSCDWKFERKKEDFFAVMVSALRPSIHRGSKEQRAVLTLHPQSSFDDIISHIRSIIHQHCPQCHTITCFACGQKAKTGSSSPENVSRIRRKMNMPPSTKSSDLALFHCANVQVSETMDDLQIRSIAEHPMSNRSSSSV